MKNIKSDLRLKLTPSEIIANSNQGHMYFYPVEFKGVIENETRNLLEALNKSLDERNNPKKRNAATRQVDTKATIISNTVFGTGSTSTSNTILMDLLKDLIKDAYPRPIEIAVDGDWSELPWELLKIPPVEGAFTESKFLGEVAIIASHFPHNCLEKHNAFPIEKNFRLVSIAGHNLSYVTSELSCIGDLVNDNFISHKIVKDFSKSKSQQTSHANYDRFMREINEPIAPDMLHGAFHSNTPNDNIGFEIVIDKNAHLVSEGFLKTLGRPSRDQMAFFNTCQGVSTSSWFKGGIGNFALKRWNSYPVITSIAKINDEKASEFSKLFINRVLPLSGAQGEPVGKVLFEERNNWLRRKTPDRLLGLSYRILGNPRRYYTSIKAELAA